MPEESVTLHLAELLSPAGNFDLARVKALLLQNFVGLEVGANRLRIDRSGWLNIELDGRDTEVATELLRRKYRLAKATLHEMEVADDLRLYVLESSDRLYLRASLGLEEEGVSAQIPVGALRAQLTDGKEFSLNTIRSLYCLQPNVPLECRITGIDHESRTVTCWISDSQRQLLREWAQLPFDRIIAVGALVEDLSGAIRRVGLTRDVIEVDSLSLGVHTLLCKVGTEAPGIIHKLGPRLPRGIKLYAFIPRKITSALKTEVPSR